MTDNYYGAERCAAKVTAARMLFGIALVVLSVLFAVAMMSLEAV